MAGSPLVTWTHTGDPPKLTFPLLPPDPLGWCPGRNSVAFGRCRQRLRDLYHQSSEAEVGGRLVPGRRSLLLIKQPSFTSGRNSAGEGGVVAGPRAGVGAAGPGGPENHPALLSPRLRVMVPARQGDLIKSPRCSSGG